MIYQGPKSHGWPTTAPISFWDGQQLIGLFILAPSLVSLIIRRMACGPKNDSLPFFLALIVQNMSWKHLGELWYADAQPINLYYINNKQDMQKGLIIRYRELVEPHHSVTNNSNLSLHVGSWRANQIVVGQACLPALNIVPNWSFVLRFYHPIPPFLRSEPSSICWNWMGRQN